MSIGHWPTTPPRFVLSVLLPPCVTGPSTKLAHLGNYNLVCLVGVQIAIMSQPHGSIFDPIYSYIITGCCWASTCIVTFKVIGVWQLLTFLYVADLIFCNWYSSISSDSSWVAHGIIDHWHMLLATWFANHLCNGQLFQFRGELSMWSLWWLCNLQVCM